jgi:membrane protein DedA with SNARE-associated domain
MTIATFLSWLLAYKYWALFPIAVIEGPIITVAAGFLVSLGVLNPIIAYVVIVAGDTVGDVLHYAVGYFGGQRFIKRWGKYFGVSLETIIPLEKTFADKGHSFFFWGKALHGIGGALLIAAGLIRYPFGKFLVSNVLGTLVKSAILMVIGFYFGKFLGKIDTSLNIIAAVMVALVPIAIVIYFYWRKKTNHGASK